jgi:hypothetical protein
MALCFLTQESLDKIAKGVSYNDTYYDTGWQYSGYEYEVPETYNGSPVRCVRFTFRMNPDNEDVINGFIQSVIVSKTPASIDFRNGFTLGLASGGVVEVIDTTEMDALGDLIDESGVLDAEGTVTEKVEQLIDKANSLNAFECIRDVSGSFYGTKTFPSKAVVNLPNAYNVYQAFAYWNTEPIPIVEELTVNAPKITVSNNQSCMGQMFVYNNGVKKVILNMPDESQYMVSTFNNMSILEEIVLGFSTKNVVNFNTTFGNSRKLKKITGVLNFSSATNVQYMFSNCNSLEEIRFEPNTLSTSIEIRCPNLTSDSVQSIIDGLATVETTKTLTFIKSLDDGVRLTDERKAQIEAKGWTLSVW